MGKKGAGPMSPADRYVHTRRYSNSKCSGAILLSPCDKHNDRCADDGVCGGVADNNAGERDVLFLLEYWVQRWYCCVYYVGGQDQRW